ncbi:MAG TPA: glycosyltransferase family 2 protein, partial [Longimicrobiaceae bacterium]|nr:glycosyltransferase family 2 protein [Longimicrobiaceae bacterium]
TPGRSHPSLFTLLPPPAGRSGWPWTEDGPRSPAAPAAEGALPRVTVVVPSFNQGRFIEETLRSVLLQGYPDLELIVMDGGSTDETVDVLRRYEPWLTYWVSERDRGQTHAINKGLERATGEVFGYLNSDDLLMPGALHAVAAGFREHPEADVVYGRCVYIAEDGTEQFTVQGRVTGFLDYLQIWKRLFEREFLTQPEVFCRTRSIVEAGGFREELRSVMDLEMWLRLLARGHRFQAVDAPVAKFRLYAAQKSSVDPGNELCRVVEEYIRESGLVPPAEQRRLLHELREARAHLLVRAAIAATMLDRRGDALRLCGSAAAASPRIVATYPFWAVLASPAKRFVPSGWRGTIRRVFGAARA